MLSSGLLRAMTRLMSFGLAVRGIPHLPPRFRKLRGQRVKMAFVLSLKFESFGWQLTKWKP